MGKAEKLLSTLNVDDPELRPVSPSYEKHVVIGEDRTITVPKELQRVAVQYDQDMSGITFNMPRYSDGIDMSKMKVYVNYFRPDGSPGTYLADDVTIDKDNPDFMSFSWIIRNQVT